MDDLLANPWILLIVGYALSEWRNSRQGQVQSARIDADFGARLQAVETALRDHTVIHACVAKLATRLEAFVSLLDRLSRRVDQMLDHQREELLLRARASASPSTTRRSPYEVPEGWGLEAQPSA